MLRNALISLILLGAVVAGCNPKDVKTQTTTDTTQTAQKGVKTSPFGQMPDGQPVTLYTLTNSQGVVMKVMNYGGIITSLEVPDRNGRLEDIVLGYDSLSGYLASNPFFGALIGRYGNRIAKGRFSLDGKTYTLATNNGPNHLHGGNKGFDKVYWNIAEHQSPNGVAVRLTYESRDLEEGYPGNLSVSVVYNLTDNNELELSYEATTDKKTIVNLTQHTYFNLSACRRDILDHELQINADRFIPVDQTLIPAGNPAPVAGTPFDFRAPMRIGTRINEAHDQLRFGKGYDHCWVLSNSDRDELSRAAVLYDSATGREVTVMTTEPGIQFYSGNFLDGSITGKKNTVYKLRYGLCLETQHFPDSPNRKDFPSVVLEPGQKYTSKTTYRFAVR